MQEQDAKDVLEVVLSAVRDAGELLRAEVARPGGPRGAGEKAPVDAEIGALLTARLLAVYPNDHIICEEGGGHVGTSERAFHIDPNDGTRDFLNGRRENAISVGLVASGRLVLGVVYAPVAVPLTGGKELLVSWALGQPLCYNGEPVAQPSARPTTLTKESLVLISTRIQGERLEANRSALSPARVEHCASIATRCALVAIGLADAALTINHTLSSWDFAAGQALLQAAGGDIVGPDGQPIPWEGMTPAPVMGYFGARQRELAANVSAQMAPLLTSTR